MKQLFCIPQWQDSGPTNEIYHGSLALKEYCESLLSNQITEISVEEHSILRLEKNIYGYSIILKQLKILKEKLEIDQPEKTISIGGGCGIEVPIVSYLKRKYENLNLFWFDAHGDLNSPESSPSKYFHGMPLQFIVDNQFNEISSLFETVSVKNIHLIGTRDLDEPEQQFIKTNSIDVVQLSDNYWNKIAEITESKTASYIHIDLDVLDPSEYQQVKCPVRNGMTIEMLVKSVRKIKEYMNVVGISIVENTETDQDKLNKLKPLIDEVLSI